MHPAVQHDFDWQRQFIPVITPILGAYLIKEAPELDDRSRATDFMVLELGAVRVACRVRRWKQLVENPNYGDQFTIRAHRPSGQETELSKIVSGWASYLFYAFADETETGLAAWLIGDLNVYRLWLARCLRAGTKAWRGYWNRDRRSYFHAYDINDLPVEFVVDRKPPTLVVSKAVGDDDVWPDEPPPDDEYWSGGAA